jgi:hypothetical protein
MIQTAKVGQRTSSSVFFDWTGPEVRPDGSNGVPITNYTIDLASPRLEVQKLTIVSTDASFDDMIAVELDGAKTRCFLASAPPSEIELKLEELVALQDVSVVLSPDSASNVREFIITFKSPNIDISSLVDASSSCGSTQMTSTVTVQVESDGLQKFVPEIIKITTTQSANTKMAGQFEIAYGFSGDFVKLLMDDSSDMDDLLSSTLLTATISRGKRELELSTSGDNVIVPGMKLRIGGTGTDKQTVTVDTIDGRIVTFHPYYVGDATNENIYVQDTYIGWGHVFDNGLVTAADELTKMVQPQDKLLFQAVVNGVLVEEVATVSASPSGNSNFTLTTDRSVIVTNLTKAAIYKQKTILVDYDVSAEKLKEGFEYLTSVGSVDVTRYGPSEYDEYTWSITFTSNIGSDYCGGSIESCMQISNKTTYAITETNGNACLSGSLGTFYSDTFSGGYRSYESPTVPLDLVYNGASWVGFEAFDENSVTISSCAFTRDTTRPTILTGSVAKSSIRQATIPAITNIVKSIQGTGHVKEVQSIIVNSTDGLFLGGFDLKFGHPFENAPTESMYFRCDESAEDMEYKLESLSTIGDVSVSRTILTSTTQPGYEGITRFSGYQWLVTFISNEGDLPMIKDAGSVDGISLFQYDATIVPKLYIEEVVKGTKLSYYEIIDELTPGQEYTMQVYANSEAGKGISSFSEQKLGLGVRPLSTSVEGKPDAPIISGTKARSASQIELSITPPIDDGASLVNKYVVEVAPALDPNESFVGGSYYSFIIYNTNELQDTHGFWRIHYHDEETNLLRYGASKEEVESALIYLPTLSQATVTMTPDGVNHYNGYNYTLTFSTEVGTLALGDIEVDLTALT